jgi:DNA invertase Pin-like site-specific DNA recombinase
MSAKRNKTVRCVIYSRVSTDQGLEQDFNSLDAQYDASQAYIRSQAHAGWTLIRTKYEDGGFSGGNTERPALQRLLADIRATKIDVIVVYKVDRLTRSLADFAKLVELFDQHHVSFVSVTQQFNTTTSMGRLTHHGSRRAILAQRWADRALIVTFRTVSHQRSPFSQETEFGSPETDRPKSPVRL